MSEGARLVGRPVAHPPAARRLPGARRLKRVIDVVGATLFLVLVAPALALIAITVVTESRGPVLFRQERIGRNGRPFAMWKFRTMVADAERLRGSLVALSRDPDWLDLDVDPRVTRIGRILRKSSLDELPQLVNVVRGQMSLVGPRPLIPVDPAVGAPSRRCDTGHHGPLADRRPDESQLHGDAAPRLPLRRHVVTRPGSAHPGADGASGAVRQGSELTCRSGSRGR
jgi:hypothetical protein